MHNLIKPILINVAALALLLGLVVVAAGQQRPLLTEDVDII
ncbi:MAG: hypothetical protein QOK48_2836, partial [Blastocatellia bacterium]|nr:hypothetical protein [Blastocatellia bacterium]